MRFSIYAASSATRRGNNVPKCRRSSASNQALTAAITWRRARAVIEKSERKRLTHEEHRANALPAVTAHNVEVVKGALRVANKKLHCRALGDGAIWALAR